MGSKKKKECKSSSIIGCMKTLESEPCRYDGNSYPSGHELRVKGQSQVCSGGEWVKPTRVRVPGILVE